MSKTVKFSEKIPRVTKYVYVNCYNVTIYQVIGGMKKMKKIRATIILCFVVLCICGCSSSSVEDNVTDVAKELNDQVSNITDKEDEHVLYVKNGCPLSYPNISYGEAFGEFFDDPTWKYFEADTGEDVVEFTGYCIYKDTKVKARLQFVLDMKAGTFTQGALSFNDVPQNNLITSAMLIKAFDEYAENHNIKNDETVDEDALQSGTVSQAADDSISDSEGESTPSPKEENSSEDESYEDTDNSEESYEDNSGTDDYVEDTFLIPDSDTRYLDKSDLKYFSKEECRLARNEIYARHGRMFNDKALQDYFNEQSWYVGTVSPEDFDEGVLNSIEKANAKLILKYEEKMK